MPHIGDEAGDRGHVIGLLERPVEDLHHPVLILCEPVVAGLELFSGQRNQSQKEKAVSEPFNLVELLKNNPLFSYVL